MFKVFAMICAIGISVAGCSRQPASATEGSAVAQPIAANVALPVGESQAGRQAFLDLKCTACHAVPSERDFPAPVSANPGPPMTAHVGARDVSYLLNAMISPSHQISPDSSEAVVRTTAQGRLSPMGDFSRVMTVRQLVDLQAYLRSIK